MSQLITAQISIVFEDKLIYVYFEDVSLREFQMLCCLIN